MSEFKYTGLDIKKNDENIRFGNDKYVKKWKYISKSAK